MIIKLLYGEIIVLSVTNLIIQSHYAELWQSMEESAISGDNRIRRSSENISPDRQHDPSNLANCSIRCMGQFMHAMNTTFANDSRNATLDIAEDIVKVYKEQDLDKLCKVYIPTNGCLKKCNDKEIMKKFLVGSFSFIDVMCITDNKEFKKEMPCLTKNKHEEVVEKACPMCDKYASSFKNLRALQSKSAENNMSRVDSMRKIRTVLNESCSYITCVLTCGKPVVSSMCGTGAASLMEKLFAGMFKAVNSSAIMIAWTLQINEIELSTPACKKFYYFNAT